MISYADKAFCLQTKCKHFDVDCDRALTKTEKMKAIIWWGSEDVPISINNPTECYEEKDEN